MINRILIRLKVVQLIYAFFLNEGKTTETAEKELLFSLSKAYELYNYLLGMLVDLQRLAEKRDEARQAREKLLGTTSAGVFPDQQFAANRFLLQLRENKALLAYREKQSYVWDDEDILLRKLYALFTDSDVFQLYLEKKDFSYEADRELVRKLYKNHVCNNEDFDAALEERSLYWNDDKDTIDSFVLKTIKRFDPENGADQPLIPEYASDGDREFAVKLFRESIDRADETRDLIKRNAKNWDLSRMAYMDVILMQIALTEMFTFPSIPLSVTFNEYIDIAKVYSTPQSAAYIHGTLDHIVKNLKKENLLMK